MPQSKIRPAMAARTPSIADSKTSSTAATHDADHGHDAEPLPHFNKIITLVVVLAPFVGLVAAIILLWGPGFSWLQLGLMFGMYIISGLGITIGYHRFFTHKSFETGRFMKLLLGISGSMAVEGPLIKWVATHRSHHQNSDSDHDPHSPHSHGAGFFNMMRGLWRAHMGWMFEPSSPGLKRYVVDFDTDRMVKVVSALFPAWVLLGMLIPTLLGGLITMSWTGALLGFIWGGLVRVFFVHHVTWSINSVCHIWGSQPFKSHDHSKNNPVFGVLAFGEGWHNNHHAFPTSARHGLKWWQFDSSYLTIKLMEKIGLVWNVRVPSAARIVAKQAG